MMFCVIGKMLTFCQVAERWLQQNKMQGFLLHIHEGLQDHLKSILDGILDWCDHFATVVPIMIILSTPLSSRSSLLS
jgi:hypothetical protein